jgi:hypothetical protein
MIKPSNIFFCSLIFKRTPRNLFTCWRNQASRLCWTAVAYSESEAQIDWSAAKAVITEAEDDVNAGRVRPFRDFVAEMQKENDV